MMATNKPATLGLTSSVGNNEAHENMPPYYALNTCKKVEDKSVGEINDRFN